MNLPSYKTAWRRAADPRIGENPVYYNISTTIICWNKQLLFLLTLFDIKKRSAELNWQTNLPFFRFTLRGWAVIYTISSEEWKVCLCVIYRFHTFIVY